MDDVTRKRVVVGGRVQGVWFRESTRLEAMRLGLTGWVRNLADGQVEAVFEGTPTAVDEAIEWARHGPDHAAVTSLDEFSETPEGLTGFDVRWV